MHSFFELNIIKIIDKSTRELNISEYIDFEYHLICKFNLFPLNCSIAQNCRMILQKRFLNV